MTQREQQPILDRIPPQNIDAERSVLGAMLLNPDAVGAAIEILHEDPAQIFYHEPHQHIYNAILSLFHKNMPIDGVTLGEQLTRDGHLEAAGGASYISDLAGAVPTSANIEHYARIVHEAALCRQMIRILTLQCNAAYSTPEPAKVLGDALEGLHGLSVAYTDGHEPVHIGDLKEKHEQWLYRVRDDEKGLSLGIPELDAAFPYGIQRELVVIAGRPSTGKTSLMLSFTANLARAGYLGLIVTLETNSLGLLRRLNAIVCPEHEFNLAHGFVGSARKRFDLLREHANRLWPLPIYIEDSLTNVEQICFAIRKLVAKCPEIAFVCIDYLQRLQTEKTRGKEYERLNYVLSRLIELKNQIKRPMFLLSQLHRLDKADRVPTVEDTRGSGRIEEDGDILLLLHKPSQKELEKESISDDKDTVMRVILGKQRDGPAGDSVYLRFHKRQTLVTTRREPKPELEPEDEELPF